MTDYRKGSVQPHPTGQKAVPIADNIVRTALCVKNDMENGVVRIKSVTATAESVHTRVVIYLESEEQFKRLEVIDDKGQPVIWGVELATPRFEPNMDDGMVLPILVRGWNFTVRYADKDLR